MTYATHEATRPQNNKLLSESQTNQNEPKHKQTRPAMAHGSDLPDPYNIINDMYYISSGIITIFLNYVLCMILGIMWIICIHIHKLGRFLNK